MTNTSQTTATQSADPQSGDPLSAKCDKATVIIAQLFISALMALVMTLLFGTLLPHGIYAGWVKDWAHHFITAWPVAFVLSLGIGPLSFALSNGVTRRIWAR